MGQQGTVADMHMCTSPLPIHTIPCPQDSQNRDKIINRISKQQKQSRKQSPAQLYRLHTHETISGWHAVSRKVRSLPTCLPPLFCLPMTILHTGVSGIPKPRIHHVQLLLNTPVPIALFALVVIFILINSKWTCLLFSSLPSSPPPHPHSRPCPNQTQHRVSKTESQFCTLSPRLLLLLFSPSQEPALLPGCRLIILDASSPLNPIFNLCCLSWIISWIFSCLCLWHLCPFVLPFHIACSCPSWKQPTLLLTPTMEAFRGESHTHKDWWL